MDGKLLKSGKSSQMSSTYFKPEGASLTFYVGYSISLIFLIVPERTRSIFLLVTKIQKLLSHWLENHQLTEPLLWLTDLFVALNNKTEAPNTRELKFSPLWLKSYNTKSGYKPSFLALWPLSLQMPS